MGKLQSALQKVFDAMESVIDLVEELKSAEDEERADLGEELYSKLYDEILDPLNEMDSIAKEADL